MATRAWSFPHSNLPPAGESAHRVEQAFEGLFQRSCLFRLCLTGSTFGTLSAATIGIMEAELLPRNLRRWRPLACWPYPKERA